jgi:hypothetical protein
VFDQVVDRDRVDDVRHSEQDTSPV